MSFALTVIHTAAVVAFYVRVTSCVFQSRYHIRTPFTIIIVSHPPVFFFLSLSTFRFQALVVSLLLIKMNWISVLILGVEVRRDKRQTFCLFYFTFLFVRSFIHCMQLSLCAYNLYTFIRECERHGRLYRLLVSYTYLSAIVPPVSVHMFLFHFFLVHFFLWCLLSFHILNFYWWW